MDFFEPRTQADLGPDPVFRVFHARDLCPLVCGLDLCQANPWRSTRHSNVSPNGPAGVSIQVHPAAAAGFGLMLQGVVEIIRCILCIRDGEWPSREQDVEEVDVEKLKEMVHVKDEDIAALDKYVVAQEQGHPSHEGNGQMKIRKDSVFRLLR
jgi:hypothetical protein